MASLPSRFSRALILLAALAASSCGVPAFATCPSTPTDCGSPTVDNITVLGSVIGGSISGSAIVGGTMNGTAINGGSITGTPIGLSAASTGAFTALSGMLTNPASVPQQGAVTGTANITQVGGSYAVSGLYGVNGVATTSSSATANTTGIIAGIAGSAFINGTGTNTYAVGGTFGVFDTAASGTITRGFGAVIQAPSAGNGAAITNSTGLYIQNTRAGTNNTTIEINTTLYPVPPTGNYSIYDAETALSYFAGPMEFAGSFTANGSTALSLTNIGPSGASSTVQEWFTVKDAAGTTRYIPAF